jgi:hypothetical protein
MDEESVERIPGECFRRDPGRNRALLFFNNASYDKKNIALKATRDVNEPLACEAGTKVKNRKRRK